MRTYLGGLAVLLASAWILAACEGDTGAQGPAGPGGPAGPPGPPGPGGSSSALPIDSAKAITALISGVTVAADTRATVQFSLANELGQPLRGLPAANLRFTAAQLRAGGTGQGSVWLSYVTRLDGSTSR